MDWSGSVEKDKARNSDKPFLASQTHLECTDLIPRNHLIYSHNQRLLLLHNGGIENSGFN